MSIDRTEGAELGIVQLTWVDCRIFLFWSPDPPSWGAPRSELRHLGADRKVVNREAVPLTEELGDPAAVTDPPVGFVA